MQNTSATSLDCASEPESALRVAPTALADALSGPATSLAELGGALSYPVFNALPQELAALTSGVGAFDLGYRGQIAVGGEDRVRWLNGMLTNSIQDLTEGTGNYSFVLNAQGRIQGDCDAFLQPDRLLVFTDRGQLPGLLAHFNRFIIMDDVILEDISATGTALGLAGPFAPQLLTALGVSFPKGGASDALWLTQTRICGLPVQLTGGYPTASPRFELWCAKENVRTLWDVLLAAGAVPCGLLAAEALRVLEGIPRYGVDITDRHLPQETGQTRSLHFAKGCYLGQEIVERIRSRAQVHRRLAQFTLSSEPAALPLDLSADGENAPVGRITSTALYGGTLYGLGIVRSEAVDRHPSLEFPGGTATLLAHAPLAQQPTQPT